MDYTPCPIAGGASGITGLPHAPPLTQSDCGTPHRDIHLNFCRVLMTLLSLGLFTI